MPSTVDPFDVVTLAAVHGVGARRFAELLEREETATAALTTFDADVVSRARFRAERWVSRARSHDIHWTVRGDAAYPASLQRLEDPPPVVWWSGALALASAPAMAIVGTRRASTDGRQTAWLLAERASRHGTVVVSGLAVGIDAAAHDGALRAGGDTIAVTGTGIDVPYPAAHAPLLEEVRTTGLVITEAPPGTPPSLGAFPRRNRIIAALARLVIVVEAGHKSGALNTAQHAIALDTLVAAVPGSIASAQCAGSNALLRDGAQVIASLDDLDVLLSMAHARPPAGERPRGVSAFTTGSQVPVTPATTAFVEGGAPTPTVPSRTTATSAAAPRRPIRRQRARTPQQPTERSDAARTLLALIERAPSIVDELIVRSGLDTRQALAAVSELELEGAVRVGLDGLLRTRAQARRA
ncbi:MAG: DNA-processing protein DprA [Gemmatimonadaceae bacterium]|jgi:DNA processing protein|nr:DNA-processing protein DprA [Gemmatimonadaceae bacterium]